MSVFYKCQLCGGMGETKLKHRRPPHWSTVTVHGPGTACTEYDASQPCTEDLRSLFHAPTLPLEIFEESIP